MRTRPWITTLLLAACVCSPAARADPLAFVSRTAAHEAENIRREVGGRADLAVVDPPAVVTGAVPHPGLDDEPGAKVAAGATADPARSDAAALADARVSLRPGEEPEPSAASPPPQELRMLVALLLLSGARP